jgi:ABC-2 type transport system ATP-binding protein
LCPRVLVIDQGRILYDGSLETIRARYSTGRMLAVEFEELIPDFTPPGAVLTRSEGRKKWFAFNRNDIPASALIAAISERYSVADLTVTDVEIEEVIRSMYADRAVRVAE